MQLRFYFLFIFGLLGLFLSPSNTYAQDDLVKVDTASLEKPEAFPVIDLSERLEAVNEDYEIIESRLANGEKILSIDTQLALFEKQLEGEYQQYQRFRRVSPNRQKLDNLIKRWRTYAEKVNQWLITIDGHQNKASNLIRETQDELESWRLTLSSEVNQELPERVVNDFSSTISRLDSFIVELEGQEDLILDLESRLTEKKLEIEDIAKDLETWIQSGELNIFYLRHEPIWNTSFSFQTRPLQEGETSQWDTRVSELKEHINSYANRIQLFFLGGLLIIGLVFYIRSKKIYDHPIVLGLSNDYFKLVYRMPLVVGFFLSIFWGWIYFKNLPETASEAMAILLLLLTYVMLWRHTDRRFKWIIPIILLAFILDFVKSYFWFSSSNYRLYMYSESIFSLFFLYYFLRQITEEDKRSFGPVQALMLKGVYLLIFFQVVSIISNTLGYTNLSDLALKLSTTSLVIGAISYGLIIALEGLVTISIIDYYANKGKEGAEVNTFLESTERYIKIIAGFFWLGFVLVATDLHIILNNTLGTWLKDPYLIGSYSITPANIFYFIFVVLASYFLTRFISFLFDGEFIRASWLPSGWLAIISMVARYFVIGIAVFISLGVLGIDLKNFTLVAGALGLGIGFGLKEMVSNFIAGIILAFEQPMKSGDTIQIGSMMGIVGKVGIRSSSIRSFDGADVTVPNNKLLSSDLINWTHQDLIKRIEIKISAAYGSDPNKVLDVMSGVAQNYPDVLHDPAPLILFDEFGNSSLNFRMLCWVPVEMGLSAKSGISVAVYNAFTESGIEIPFPRYDVTLLNEGQKKADEDQ